MEDENIIYNKTNDNITPIDTSAKDFVLKAELEKAKRALLEEQQAMYQDIDVTHKTR